jgi:hypothetical protein
MTALTPTRITDWDVPGLPLLLRVFNAVGGWPAHTFISLDSEDLLSAASKQTGLTNFGDDRFREALIIEGTSPKCSAQDPGHPNWIHTQGHKSGVLWAHWFLPEETPTQPTTRVVKVTDV